MLTGFLTIEVTLEPNEHLLLIILAARLLELSMEYVKDCSKAIEKEGYVLRA